MIEIGRYSYDVNSLKIKSWGEDFYLRIGHFCSIGGNVSLYLGGNHNTKWITTFPFGHISRDIFDIFDGNGHPNTDKNFIVIENDVWIGGDSSIYRGVTIGNGAVIAANSHVVHDVEPYSIVGGNPAKLLKYRFTEDIIEKLLKIRWWDLGDETINKLTPFLCSENFDMFFEEVEKFKK